ncbi:M48 family metallopeptidase [Marinomonas gallaica]|uniref:M48 family metallopeptidase n=1 Tax=Marinomonas gallaica TaxID=1806667 RepID=UPI00082A39B4|nr:M48 family metallopeptidase [Marinomonas gallaica]
MTAISEPIVGTFQHAASSRIDAAKLCLDLDGDQIIVSDHLSDGVLQQQSYSSCSMSSRLPGVPMTLSFGDGASFTPADPDFSWPNSSKSSSFIYWLERKWLYGLLAIGLMIGFLTGMVKVAIPFAAVQVASVVPMTISQGMGQQSLSLLDQLYFEESELESDTMAQVQGNWDVLLERLELPQEHYQLQFRSWHLGPNAMALADGTVVVTDSIVELMQDDLHLLDAILLHEIGHVEHRHSLQAVIRTTITTVLYAIIFGDIEGAGEVVLGAGVGLVDLSFSREMEREADQFAYQHLLEIDRSSNDFAMALRKLKSAYPMTDSDDKKGWNYLQSHPDIDQRIEARPH